MRAHLVAVGRRVRAALRGFPADCGAPLPASRYRDLAWADDVSPDQARIEQVLDGLVSPDARVLHLGVGTSHLARRFAARSAWIDGVTVVPAEVARAEALGLPRYRAVLANKYGGLGALPGPYDLVVDNNVASFACCRRHVDGLFADVAARLSPGGRFLTDAAGLAYRGPSGTGLGWAEWAAYGAALGLVPERRTASVWGLRRQ
ncbi:MAG: hypothetical protein ACK4YP_24285 [Myxococcota bacterium]